MSGAERPNSATAECNISFSINPQLAQKIYIGEDALSLSNVCSVGNPIQTK